MARQLRWTNLGDPHENAGTWDFCAGNRIFISPSLELRVVSGRGTGVYTTKPVLKGRKLMHVPTKALYTIASIPTSFADPKVRRRTPVHALLAAYLTFGDLETEHDQYARWMATWPQLLDLTTSMPMFWPEKCRLLHSKSLGDRGGAKTSFDVLPPPTTGAWLLTAVSDKVLPGGSTSLADHQLKKLQNHIDAVVKLVPQYAPALRDPHDSIYWRFVYNWCCLNTRCFYYVAPGHKHPADPNEAMAMCPGMDMFNHTQAVGCTTKYDRTGYSVVADKAYEADEEIFLSYGAHTNDVLWAEYGFILDENAVDAIRIDRLVLDSLHDKQKDLLAEYGYLGEYYLKNDGLCWRTEVVAWMTVLTEKEWMRMVQEGWDPVGLDLAAIPVRRKLGSSPVAIYIENRLRRQKGRLIDWLLKGKREVEGSLRGLSGMSDKDLPDVFGTELATLRAQGVAEVDLQGLYLKQATERHTTCLKRWKQIWQTFVTALKSIEMECAGSFITLEPGRMQHDLDVTLEAVLGLSSDRK